jgi:hypothetical protein
MSKLEYFLRTSCDIQPDEMHRIPALLCLIEEAYPDGLSEYELADFLTDYFAGLI